MGFDLYLVPPENPGKRPWWRFWAKKEEPEHPAPSGDEEEEEASGERLFDVGGFFALAEALGNTIHILRESGVSLDLGDEESIPYVKAWEAYIAHPHKKKFQRRFVEYCDNIRGMFRQIESQIGGFKPITGGELRDVKASEFDPDVQAALGRALLPTEPHSPEEAAALVPIAFFMGGLLAGMSSHLRENGQVETADHLQSVGMSLAPLVNLASEAEERGWRLVVDY